MLAHSFPPEILIMALEEGTVIQSKYKVLAAADSPYGRLVVGRWRPQRIIANPSVIPVIVPKDIQMLNTTRTILPPNGRLIILTHYPPMAELKGIVSKWSHLRKNQ